MLINMKDFIKFVTVYALVCLSWVLLVIEEVRKGSILTETFLILAFITSLFAAELLLLLQLNDFITKI